MRVALRSCAASQLTRTFASQSCVMKLVKCVQRYARMLLCDSYVPSETKAVSLLDLLRPAPADFEALGLQQDSGL